jgi:hypothetical protein
MNSPSDLRRFSLDVIPEKMRQLSPIQRELLERIWNHFITSGLPLPARALQIIIGKQQTIEDTLKGLNGCLLVENLENNDRSFSLKMYGAFLTPYGPVLAALLFRLLEWLKKICEDPDIKILDSRAIRDGLELSEADSTRLFFLLRLGIGSPPEMPFSLSNNGPKATDPWAITLNTNAILDLYRCDDVRKYLDERLSAGYNSDEPYESEGRLKRYFQQIAALHSGGTETKGPTGGATKTGRRIWGGTSALFGVVLWFSKETINAWFFDKVLHVVEPHWGQVVEYGVPTAFFAAALYLVIPKASKVPQATHD